MCWQWGAGGLKAGGNLKFWFLIGVAIGIRLLVMPITLHGDLLYIWSVPTLLVEGVTDPYTWVTSRYPEIARSDWDVYYPPAAFVINGIWLGFLRLFSSNLIPWLVQSREIIFSLDLLRFNLAAARLNLFILKVPYLIYEVLIIWGLVKLVGSNRRRKVITLWLFSPVVIYSAYMMGQIDLLTATLVVWAAVAAVRGRKLVSLTLLVIGTMAKVLPIVLIVPMAFLMGKSWKERVGLAFYSILIFIIFNLPFVGDLARLGIAYFPPIMPGLADLSWRPDALVMISKLLAAAGVLAWLGWKIIRSKQKIKPEIFPEIIGLVLLLFFSAYRGGLFNHYVVLTPFLILFWVKERCAVLKIMVFSGLLFLTHIYTRPLMGELFTPLGIGWLTDFPSTRELVAAWFKYEHLSLLTGAVLAGWMITEVIVRGKRILIT